MNNEKTTTETILNDVEKVKDALSDPNFIWEI